MSADRELAAHLRYYERLGVSGLSRDAGWRRRASASAGDGVVETAAESAESPAPEPHRPPAAGDPVAALAALRSEIGSDCSRCVLHTLGRSTVVFGVGSPSAELMFVGEAPGADEDLQGEPFVGKAGQLLTRIIEAIDLKRSDVYIANVIKCRPPGNRNPEPVEVQTCSPFLLRQIEIVAPRVIVALGTFAAQMLLATDTPISKLRGRVHAFRGGIKLVPTFHPAYLLRSPERKRDVWDDMKRVRELLATAD